jgi:tRNA(Ile)-lysidine synthase
MASSRKPHPKLEPVEQQLLDIVRSAVAQAAATRPPRQADMDEPLRAPRGKRPTTLVIGFSGGRDSTALLDLCQRLRQARVPEFRNVLAVHVHHGLHPQADQWAAHCARTCAALGVPFESRRVEVKRRGRGIEAAARDARYEALADAARKARARFVLTAHHLDDRLETFLIQWLRGAGPEGLAAFPATRAFGEGQGKEPLALVRPLIDVDRRSIDAYVDARGLTYIEDSSNTDTALLRNALRAGVLPALDAARPGFRKAAARAVDLVAEAAEALRDVAAQDLRACSDSAPPGMLRLDKLAQLPPARQSATLRRWLADAGIEAPPRARLIELLRQALTARSDARMLVRFGTRELRRHRGLLLLREAKTDVKDRVSIAWQGEEEVALPGWSGRLRFVPTDGEGFDADWLRAQPLEVRGRSGGERFKPHPTRPSKTLKRLFQDAGIAEFERGALPLLWRGNELIFVAGLGPDARLVDRGGERVRIEWRADEHLLKSY